MSAPGDHCFDRNRQRWTLTSADFNYRRPEINDSAFDNIAALVNDDSRRADPIVDVEKWV